MTVVTIKTISGDEYIGRLVENNEENKEYGIITLSNPLVIIHTPQGIALMKGVFSSDKDVPFFINSLAVPPIETNNEFTTAYIKETSGLVLNTTH